MTEYVPCPACQGTGNNRYVPKLTEGMYAACPRCDGAGVVPASGEGKA